MKYKYAKVKKGLIILFCLLYFSVLISNLIGFSRYPYISIFNYIVMLATIFGSSLTTVYILTGYKKFDLNLHRRIVKNFKTQTSKSFPTVDIFLPSCGEKNEVLERTYKAVCKLHYPKDKTNVYVLDDSDNDEAYFLAKKYGFYYLSRPNKGEYKKAGNLKYGYEHSTGKYILILDADFAPSKEIINELICYLEKDEIVGIALSPQDFVVNKNEPQFIQKGDISIQEFFYKICQNSRSKFNAAICTGTNALYRRSALEKAGGFYQIEHSEDSHTGLSLVKNGYTLLYVPIILAKGYCPSDYNKLYKQRSRWCQGSLALMKTKMFKEAKLGILGRISYWSGFYYYVSSALLLIIPFNTLYLLYTIQKPNIIDTLFFLPNVFYLFLSYTFFYYSKFNFSVLGNQFFFYFTYIFTSIKSLIFRINEPWAPTGSILKKNSSYKLLLYLIIVYIAFYWILCISIFVHSHFNVSLTEYLLLFWVIYTLITHISFVTGLINSERDTIRRKLNEFSWIKFLFKKNLYPLESLS